MMFFQKRQCKTKDFYNLIGLKQKMFRSIIKLMKLLSFLFVIGLEEDYSIKVSDCGVALLLKLLKDKKYFILEIQGIVQYLNK
jgi:hypothetical protein